MTHSGWPFNQDGTLDVDWQWSVWPAVPVASAQGVPVPAAVAPITEPTAAVPAAAAPSDPLFSQQWYLQNTGQGGGTLRVDIDVVPAWTTATGKGVTIVVNDTGVDYTNPDIAPNYDAATSYSLDSQNNNAYPTNGEAHGTNVTGLIAAANNGYGIVGVAYNATVSAYRVIDTAYEQEYTWQAIADALTNTASFDVANNSWEFTTAFEDSVFNQQDTIATNALLTAAQNGRGGFGTINVFAAGNGYANGDDTNLHAFQSSINVVTVAALDDNGTVNAPGGRYSTPGATILVSAPGTGILSDTIVGQGNVPGNANLESGLDGTSFATPLVTGVIALMLQANPNLGLRDVQEILAYTARQTDPTDPTWHINDAVNWNGGGLHVSNDYGFGLVDAAAAVALAKSWTTQDTANNRTIDTVNANATGGIAATGTTFSFTVPTGDSLTLNWVRVQLDFYFAVFDNLRIVLTSPGGASSVLLNQPNDGMGASSFNNIVQLTSDQFWGQNSVGTWQVWIGDAYSSFHNTGTLFSATLVLVGDPPPASNTYIYTNEYATEAASDLSREVLSDPGSSGDTLNVAAVTTSCTLDLVPGLAGNIGGTPFTIASGTTITNVYTGSGADTIDVNSVADTVTSEGGADTVVFPGKLASYTLGSASSSQVTVTLGGVTDTLNNVTTLQFADQSVATSTIVACFAEGTWLCTERGEVAVETLCVGDRVFARMTGTLVPIVWIGRRRVDCARHPRPHSVWPVRILAGAFGERLPARDLLLSPDHAIYADGALIPVRHLVNGTTIRQEPVSEISYFHVQLPRHDVVLAESLPVESFLDTGNRSAFANGGGAIVLHPDFTSRIWEAEGCAPLVVIGPALVAVQRQLHARSVALAGPRMNGSRAAPAWFMLGQPDRGESDAGPGRKHRHRGRARADGEHVGSAPQGDHGRRGASSARVRP